MSTNAPQATSLQRVIISFDRKLAAKAFWLTEVYAHELWSSTVAPGSAYVTQYIEWEGIILLAYDKSKNRFVPDLTDEHLHPMGITNAFEDIKAWAGEKKLEFKSVDATAIRFHKSGESLR